MKKIFAWLLCALLLVLSAPALAVVQPNDLFYVYDGAGVFSEDTEATIVLNNDALYEECGAQIVIAAIDSAGTMQLGDYAYTLFDEWGIGSADKNNGVLVLMEIGAEDYWYMQGSGLERNLSTGDLAELVDKYLEPDFAKGNYDAGAEKLFEQIFARVADIYGADVRYREYDAEDLYAGNTAGAAADVRPEKKGGGISIWMILLVVIVLVVVVNSMRRKSRFTSRTRRSAPTVIVQTPPRARPRGFVRSAPPPPQRRMFTSSAPRRTFTSSSSRRMGGGGSFSSNSGARRSSGFGGGRSGGFSRGGGGGGSRGGGGGRGR